ncbi:MAG: HprK-related kinase A [Pseudomonadota bacterium]
MRRLKDLSDAELWLRMKGTGLRLHVGPYIYCIQSPDSLIHGGLRTLYAHFPVAENDTFADYHIELRPSSRLQQLRGKIDFFSDERLPFDRIDNKHAYAFLEWGMNWCVSVNANEYLKLHSAVVSKDENVLILPGLPGAGKSTLCAAMALSGWRVLSDEHALVRLDKPEVVPICRPISLKNESISVIAAFSSEVVMGPHTRDTHKGDVVHVKADLHPDSHDFSSLPAKLMVFPQFEPGSETVLTPRSRAESFMFAAHHSFNYGLLGQAGFRAMETLIDALECFDLKYSDLDEAIHLLSDLHQDL